MLSNRFVGRQNVGVFALGLAVLSFGAAIAPGETSSQAREIEGDSQPNLVGRWDVLRVKKKGKNKILQATLRVSNDGNASAGESRVRFFLSPDRTLSEEDAPLTVKFNGNELPVEVPVDALAAGASKTFKFDGIKVSKRDYASKLKGKYLLGVVDFSEAVTESNEDDNVFPRDGDPAHPL